MLLRAIPFEYTWGGGGVERSPIKKSWGEGVKIKTNHWARGLSNIEKHGAGGGGGGLPGKKGHVVICDLNSGTYHSGTYQNCLSYVAILECTSIVQFRYVPELSDYTILVRIFVQNCYFNSGTYQN